MKLSEWQGKMEAHNQKVAEAAKALRDAEFERDKFFQETIGFESRSVATLPGTVAMIHAVIAMEKEEAGGK